MAASTARSAPDGDRNAQGVRQDAAAVIAIGSCSSWGGMPATDPNPTGAVGVGKIIDKPVVTIPAVRPTPTTSSPPCSLPHLRRLPPDGCAGPAVCLPRLVHENCERRAHFDAGASRWRSATMATARATACTSSAARVRKPTPTARRCCSAMLAAAPGRSVAAIPASAAPSRGRLQQADPHGRQERTSSRRASIRASSRRRAPAPRSARLPCGAVAGRPAPVRWSRRTSASRTAEEMESRSWLARKRRSEMSNRRNFRQGVVAAVVRHVAAAPHDAPRPANLPAAA